jgi:hypothetical protein
MAPMLLPFNLHWRQTKARVCHVTVVTRVRSRRRTYTTRVWYSDTVSFDFAGCEGLAGKEVYDHTMPAVHVDPGSSSILVAAMT